jgi:hypothetical protein
VIFAIVQLLIAVPKLLELFIKIANAIEKEMGEKVFDSNRKLIDDWVRVSGDKNKDS